MIPVEIATLALDMRGEPVLILRPIGQQNGPLLPIWIGAQEANAIMLAHEQVTASRPMSYDLMAKLLEELGARVTQVAVTRIDEGTYYAEITLEVAGEERVIDARPSDSVALAARVGAPILVAEGVLEEAGVSGVVVDPEDEGLDPEEQEAEIEEFGRFLDSVDPEDFRG